MNYSCRRCFVIAIVMLAVQAYANDVTVTARVAWTEEKSRSVAGNNLANVVLWLVPLDRASQPVALVPKETPRLVQRNKSFEPHIQVVPVGSVVEFPNRDPFFHNVFSLFEGKRFDLGLYEAGTAKDVRFDKAGISYIFCNIHPEMSAVVIALPTPYFGVSDRRGQIVVEHVPTGRYALHMWYEAALPEEINAMTRQILVSENSSTLGVLRLTRAAAPQNHKNKYGKDYDPPAPDSPAYPRP
jgi:plastocyanin